MKKTFLTRHNAFFASENFSWGAFALILVIILLLLRLVAPNLFWQLFIPVFHGVDILSAKSHVFLDNFRSDANLALLNEELVAENKTLSVTNMILVEKLENIAKLQHADKKIIADIIVRPPISPYDTLVLAIGSDNGVAVGQKVYGSGGIPIGVVSDVTANISRATLFSSFGMVVSGWVGETKIPLTISGTGAGTMSATVPRSANIIIGDTVFAPGPGMLPIGSVVRIDDEKIAGAITLRIRPLLNLFSISWVAIGDSYITSP